MQTETEIEKHYETSDPWGYQSNPEDHKRKEKIIHTAKRYAPIILFYDRALDIGAGEGWITQDLPARIKVAYELSKNARERIPKEIQKSLDPNTKFDLVLATGVLYRHYDWRQFLCMIRDHSSDITITCNIKTWEVEEMNMPSFHKDFLSMHQVYQEEFSYREFIQKLRVFKKL